MATYYVSSAGDNTTGAAWATAYTSLAGALAVATSGSDIVVIDKAAIPTTDSAVTADRTWNFPSGVRVYSVTNDGAPGLYTPSIMGDSVWLGSTGAYSLTVGGTGGRYLYGLTLRLGATSADTIKAVVDQSSSVFEECTFWVGTTSIFGRLTLAAGTTTGNRGYVELNKCVFRFGSASNRIDVGGNCHARLNNCSIHASSSAISGLITEFGSSSTLEATGCDFSGLSATATIVTAETDGVASFRFDNCKMPSGAFSWMATIGRIDTTEVFVFNCSGGDNHYDFGYYNGIGSVAAVTGVYASGGAKYDGTNGVSWKIDTSSGIHPLLPFKTPWIDLYNSGTSAITPKLEILRDGSATAYDNDEVWAEFSYQGTSGSTKATIVDDRMAVGGTPAAQTTGDLGAGDWTGEGGTAWFGKLNTTSTITPAEIGMLRARVCVGVASATVYVDPYIRVA